MDRFLIDANGLEIEFRYEDNQEGETLYFFLVPMQIPLLGREFVSFEKTHRMVFNSLRGYGNTMESRSLMTLK